MSPSGAQQPLPPIDPTASYGSLALQRVPQALQAALDLLPIINATVLPKVVGPPRQALLQARTQLDVFAYAYPSKMGATAATGKLDVFHTLRKDLDSGYTLIGDFKDLAKVNYTKKDLQERLQPVLTWKADFLVNLQKFNYMNFSKDASPRTFFPRSKEHLSGDFWGGVQAIPNTILSGLQNIALLNDGQTVIAMNLYASWINLTDLWVEPIHTQFHDYRKLLRSIAGLAEFYPEIYRANVTSSLALLDDIYDSAGRINDFINAYQFYDQQGKIPQREQSKAKILSSWANLLKSLDDNQALQQIVMINKALIPHHIPQPDPPARR